MQKKGKILLIVGIILAVLAAGFFYFWYVWLPQEMANNNSNNNPGPNSQAPMLFGKDDYQIEERQDGTYVVVDKVGLTAKVPDGWTINKQQLASTQNEYRIDILSEDAKGTSMIEEGCIISITAGNAAGSVTDIKNKIELIKNNPKESTTIDPNYNFSIFEIGQKEGLRWINDKYSQMATFIGIDIPESKETIISINTTILPAYKHQCESIWQEFISNLEIK